jgi:hypothetical protein
MTPDGFRRAHRTFNRRKPFLPFVVEFHSGRQLLVSQPESLVIRDPLIHFVSPGEQPKNYVFDSSSVSMLCDLEERDTPPSQ